METQLIDLSKEELINKFYKQEELIKSLNSKIDDQIKQANIYKDLFNNSPTPMWEEDITDLISHLIDLRNNGVSNFEDYLNNNPNELSVCISKINLINVNQATLNLHSADSKKQLINNLERLFTEKSKAAFKNEIIAIANGVTSYEAETEAKTFENKIVNLKLYLNISKRIEENSIKYFALVSTVDISIQKRAEEKLMKSEIALRTILDTSDNIAILTDNNGFILESNKSCQDLYGIRRSDIIGRKMSYFDKAEYINQKQKAFNNVLETKRSVTFENEVNGRMWIHKLSPILGNDGKIEKVVIFQTDVTAKYTAEKKIKESELKYRTIFNNTPISITHIDTNGFITEINDYHINSIGRGKVEKKDFIGTNVLEREPIKLAGITKHYANLLKGTPFKLSNVLFPKTTGGSKEYFNIIGVPMSMDDNLTGAIITVDKTTDEIRTMQKLTSTQERLNLALEGAGIGLWDQDFSTNKVWRNDKWFEMLGYKKGDFEESKDTWLNLMHPDEKEDVLNFAKSHEDNLTIAVNVEHRMLNSNGEYSWILNWGKILKRDINGRPLRAAGIHMDITKRKEAQLREKQLLSSYFGIFNNSIDAIYILDSEGKFIDVNHAAEKMYGYKHDEFIGKTPEFLSAPNKNDLDFVKNNIYSALNGKPTQFDFWGLRKNGDEFPKIVRLNSVNYKGRECVVAFGLDITERYTAQLKLKESENKYSSLIEQANEAIIIVQDWKIEYCNRYTLKILGYPESEIIDSSIDNYLKTKFATELRKRYDDRLRGEHVTSLYESKVIKKDGTIIPIEINSTTMIYNGRPAVQSIIRDISERKASEIEKEKRQKELDLIFNSTTDNMALVKIDGNEFRLISFNTTFKSTMANLDIDFDEIHKLNNSIMAIGEKLNISPELKRNIYTNLLKTKYSLSSHQVLEPISIKNKSVVLEAKYTPLLNEENRCDYILYVSKDITEKINAESILKKTKEQLQFAIEGSGAGLWDWHIQTGECEFSERWAEIIGYSTSELAPMNIDKWNNFAHPDDLIKSNELLQKHFKGESETYVFEARMKHKNNNWIWVLERGKVVEWDANGNPTRMVGTHIDITERKMIEESLRQSEYIVSSSKDMLALMDKNFIYRAVNKAYLRAFKLTTDRIIGNSAEKILGNDLFNARVKPNAKKCLNGETVSYQEWFELPSSGRRYLDVNYSPYRMNENQISGVVVSARDITDKKNAESELLKSNTRLRNLSQYLNKVREEERKDFAREVHDNLGQKLTAINLDVSWMKQNCPMQYSEIHAQFDSVLDIINQSIVTVQNISTELRPGILDDLGLKNAIQWQSNEVSRKTDLKFILNLNNEELDLSDEIKTAIFRVYQEALTNIVRHSEAKNVIINLFLKKQNLIFEIIDDGIGIAKQKLEDANSFGLLGMRERILGINGTIIIKKKMKKGTIIKIEVPIEDNL